MSGKKNSGEQSIMDWLKAHDHELAEAIKSADLEGALVPQNGNGVTFLVPEDKDFRDVLFEMVNVTDKTELIQKLNSLIIPEFFGELNDFEIRPVGNIHRALFKVNREGGVMLRSAANFFSTADRALYIMTKGSPPITGGGYQRPIRKRRSQVRGGADLRYFPSHRPPRQGVADRVEDEFNKCMVTDGCKEYHPYLVNVVSLLNFLKIRHNDLYKKALFVIDYEPITTYYLLMEPYKVCGTHFIPDEVLFGKGCWNGMILCKDAKTEYMDFFEEMGEVTGAIISQADITRKRIMGSYDVSQAVGALQDAYKTLETKNSIEGRDLPLVAQSSTVEGLKKLWQDEFRYVVHVALLELRSQPTYDCRDFRAITDEFRTTRPGNNYNNEIVLINCNISVYPKAERLFLLSFINSTAFLYFPCPSQKARIWRGPKQPIVEPKTVGVYSHNASALEALDQVTRMVYEGGLSPQEAAAQQLRTKLYGPIEIQPGR
jgi:hypothetical protein